MIAFGLNFKKFKFEVGINGHKEVVGLSSNRFSWGFSQSCIGLDGLMISLYVPPFLVDRSDLGKVQAQVAASKIELTFASVFVFKDLFTHQDGKG